METMIDDENDIMVLITRVAHALLAFVGILDMRERSRLVLMESSLGWNEGDKTHRWQSFH